jgi:FAD/FMN-containing dehydrogenase
MTSLDIAGGTKPGLRPADVAVFGQTLRGDLMSPDHPDYESARKVWNGMVDRRPAMIVRCAGAADVIEAVNFARDHGLLVSVRGGGHNVAGAAVCDDGMVIDLSRMKRIGVDAERRTARPRPGSISASSMPRPRPSGSRPPWASTATRGSAA